MISRWGTIGSDVYGIGPGSRALPDIKRLQEMEKAFLMATHKSINPPLNAPARMRGKLKTLPGGENYYSNPAETVNEIYQVKFDYQGVGGAVQPTRTGCDLDHVDADADHDQGEGGRRPVSRGDRGGSACDLGALARALRTAHADRSRGHAVRTDRAVAARAGNSSLNFGMAVAVGHDEEP